MKNLLNLILITIVVIIAFESTTTATAGQQNRGRKINTCQEITGVLYCE